MFGWYSAKQKVVAGSVIYLDANGQEVECTNITQTKSHNTGWDDIVYVGEVHQYLRRTSHGELGELDGLDGLQFVVKMKELIDRAKAREADPNRWN